MIYGTLDYIRKDNEDYFLVTATFEVELMVKRLIPSHHGFPIHIRVHPENTRILRMVMNEYPFEIKTDFWQTAQAQIKQYEDLAAKVEKLDYVTPGEAHFNGKLFPFQQQCLDFLLKTNGNTLITDEMGLGKTAEAISFIAHNPSDKLPAIVVAPLVTLVNWKREIERFLRVSKSSNDQTKLFENNIPTVEIIRNGKGSSLKPADFYIINYDLVAKRFKHLSEVNAKSMIMDEIHYLRNTDTRKYEACKALASQTSIRHRIGLSGTPIYNRGIEMYNIVELLKPGILGERGEFIRRYCGNWHSQTKTDEDSRAGLAAALRKTIMIRRKKIDVLDDLPDKIRMKQEIDIDTTLYMREIEKLYREVEAAQNHLSSKTIESERKEGLFQLNKKIREMRVKERQIAGLAKTPYILEYVKNLLTDYDEEKFVVFCHHLSVHEALFTGLWQFNPVHIIGGQSDSDRQAAIDRFQNDRKCKVIICGLRAGNVGISLTAAAYVIFAELDWSPSVHRQAEDRLHRIGQKQKVIAHYLEGMGTFDVIISQILLNKTVEINNALGDKMERMNNQAALNYLLTKYNISEKTEIGKLITASQ